MILILMMADPGIDDARSLLRLTTVLRHDADEIYVEPSVITAALEQVVVPNNFKTLQSLVQSPLRFRPAEWLSAFRRGGQAFLYLREYLEPINKTLQAYQQRFPAHAWYASLLQAQADHGGGNDTIKFVKYPGQTTMLLSLEERLQVDDDQVASTRRANWDRVRREVVGEGTETFSIWRLKYVDFPGDEPAPTYQDRALAFRTSPVAQDTERILIAATGFASIGSAIGGLHYPWKTSIYEELATSVLKHMQLRAQMYSASSTQPTTPTSAFTRDMRERILKLMRDFLRQLEDRKRLQQGQGAVDDVGSIITGTRHA
ncbi:hypothetical protein A4X13_0g6950 [Tilletia indica]|uniref:Uncharacterized protein n=1 Tax=Tilletia indica TaxID=43049 RepID=A0A8T8SLR7_9BASI|nr:hypothetical protein A4X13_0g6950 [Tilletia indica]